MVRETGKKLSSLEIKSKDKGFNLYDVKIDGKEEKHISDININISADGVPEAIITKTLYNFDINIDKMEISMQYSQKLANIIIRGIENYVTDIVNKVDNKESKDILENILKIIRSF